MNQDHDEMKSEEIRHPIEPREIPPGMIATAKIDLAKIEVPEGQEIMPVAVELYEECAGDFEVIFASRGDEVLLDGENIPDRSGLRVGLRLVAGTEGNVLLVVVRNRSDTPRVLRAILVGILLPREESVLTASGLLERCMRWFHAGLAASEEDRRAREQARQDEYIARTACAEGEREHHYLEPRVRGSLRSLICRVIDLVQIPIDLVEIPLQDTLSRISSPPWAERETVLPVGTAEVLAGQSARVVARPSVPFRLTGMMLDPGIARHFLVTDVRVGKNSVFANAGSIPGIFFEHEIPLGLGEVALPGQEISIMVTNQDAHPRALSAVLIGVVGE